MSVCRPTYEGIRRYVYTVYIYIYTGCEERYVTKLDGHHVMILC